MTLRYEGEQLRVRARQRREAKRDLAACFDRQAQQHPETEPPVSAVFLDAMQAQVSRCSRDDPRQAAVDEEFGLRDVEHRTDQRPSNQTEQREMTAAPGLDEQPDRPQRS